MSKNLLYPIFIKPDNLRILIVGGGPVAEEKVTFLLKNTTPASLKVVSREFTPDFLDLIKDQERVIVEKSAYQRHHLEEVNMVIVAANNLELNTVVKSDARERNIWVNVADQPEACDFYLGGVVSRGDLKIAISTNGKAPILARRIRKYLEESIPEETEQLVDNLGFIRNQLHGDFSKKLKDLLTLTQDFVHEQHQRVEPPFR
ncbi:MAG: bifunctional precorrin-2 dehydrogenase/sirohydrochlorin ferrochelatase [Flavobacteriales bacterium]|nr:bifunctional precorrin-2 dehydrogenase/sirohydrochlorin ferrochelatase [Flavobacteriales bacterium]